jgi:glycosyltransferase involved in cell wall biosynthesis
LPKSDPRRGRKIRNVLRDSTAVITVSHQLGKAVSELGVPEEKIHVVYQGVDTAKFCPGDRSSARTKLNILGIRMLLFVGNLLPVKGVDILIDACSHLDTSMPWHLYIVGSGPLRNSLSEQATRLNISDRISFMGGVPQDDLPSWYRAADITVMASRSEGIPNVLRESMACGTPFIATDVGGISEIVRPGLGILVPPNNPASLAEAITKWLSQARREPEKAYCEMSWKESSRKLVECLQNAAGSARLQPQELSTMQPAGSGG